MLGRALRLVAAQLIVQVGAAVGNAAVNAMRRRAAHNRDAATKGGDPNAKAG